MSVGFLIVQLAISIVGGVIAGLIVSWIITAELKKHVSKETLRRIFSKEIIVAVFVTIVIIGYILCVAGGMLPMPEFHDYMVVYDKDGMAYERDACHPDNPEVPTPSLDHRRGSGKYNFYDTELIPQEGEFFAPKTRPSDSESSENIPNNP